jgi:DNA-binding LacI/PurR family transcriptional regulator
MTDRLNGDRPVAKTPRMIDVARLAGVSHQTVSRVLNASSAVGPELASRVQEAIQLLGYKRNPAARALASRRSMNLGVISFGLSLHGPSLTLFGIADTARQVGYTTSLITLADFERETIRAAFDHLEEVAVDGVVVIAPVRGAVETIRGFAGSLPVVGFEPGILDNPTSIGLDEVLGARLATRHLIELGHETVWHVSGPRSWLGTEARIRGWQQELASNRRVAHEIVEGDGWSAASGYRAGQRLAANREVTAIFAANDQMSLGVLRALREAGRRVPEDVSIVGFDDIPEASYFQPSLTTIWLDFDAVGRGCAATLLRMIREMPSELPPLPLPKLMIRASTGRPRQS